MNTLGHLAFLALGLGLMGLPLAGMLRALWRPRALADHPDLPLQTVAQAGIARFKDNLAQEFGSLLALVREDEAIRGSSKRGVPFLMLGGKRYLTEQLPPSARVLRQWVVAARHLDIPGELACERPLHAEARLSLAHNASVRTAHAGREIVIGPRARVRQWASAGLRVEAAEGAVLHGLVSAGREIVLARQVRFTHLEAPRIQFGRALPRPPSSSRSRLEMDAPPHVDVRQGVWHVSGDLHVPASCMIVADLLISGRLVLGKHSLIRGHVHADGTVHMDMDASIEGALFSKEDIALGEGCRVLGPLQAGGRLGLDACTLIGTPQAPTTVSAQRLLCAESAQVHGAVHARYSGEVLLDVRDRP